MCKKRANIALNTTLFINKFTAYFNAVKYMLSTRGKLKGWGREPLQPNFEERIALCVGFTKLEALS